MALIFALSLPKFWYWLIFGSNGYLFRQSRKVFAKLDGITDLEQKRYIFKQLQDNGQLPMGKKERWALSFLFCYLMADVFFIGCWVAPDLSLVYKPDWVMSVVEWVKSNTVVLAKDSRTGQGWFMLDIHADAGEAKVLQAMFTDEYEFLQSEFSNTAIFYFFLRFLAFVPVLIASYVLWRIPMRWLGLDRVDPRNIDGVWSFVKVAFLGLGLNIILLSFVLMFTIDITYFTPTLVNSRLYFDSHLKLNVGYFFAIIAIHCLLGWFVFWKRMFVNLFMS